MVELLPVKDHLKNARIIKQRVIAGAFLIIILMLVLIARMYFLQIVQYKYHSTLSEKNRVHTQAIAPIRGVIYDRNGIVIADNQPSFNLTFTRERSKDWRATIDVLVEILALSAEDKENLLSKVKQRARPFESVPFLYELSEQQRAIIAVNQPRLPGVEVEPQFIRSYPYGSLFAHSVGYVGRVSDQDLKRVDTVEYSGTHHIGKTGAERFYENLLHGHVGYEEVETNARGKVMRVLNRTLPTAGKDLTLTLDYYLQQVAVNALADKRGALIALDPQNGDILALVSLPSFDTNPFVTGISQKDYGALANSPDKPFLNRAIYGTYPPGSTIKPLIALTGLDIGEVTPQTKVFDPGFFQLPNSTHKYRNWNRGGDGWVDMETAIMRSNDTYFYNLAYKIGIDKLHDYLTKFGIGQKVSLDIYQEESAGIMPSREWKEKTHKQRWYPGHTLITGIGQGDMQATILQIAQAASLIANKGHWLRPHLLKEVDHLSVSQLMADNLAEYKDRQTPADIVLKNPSYWDIVNNDMQQVVQGSRGTARRIASPVYRIAGKSGTAQVVAIRQNERYDSKSLNERHRDHALFVAFAPAERPRIVVAIIVENGESGSGVAAPIVRQVMDAWLLNEQGQLKTDEELAAKKPAPDTSAKTSEGQGT